MTMFACFRVTRQRTQIELNNFFIVNKTIVVLGMSIHLSANHFCRKTQKNINSTSCGRCFVTLVLESRSFLAVALMSSLPPWNRPILFAFTLKQSENTNIILSERILTILNIEVFYLFILTNIRYPNIVQLLIFNTDIKLYQPMAVELTPRQLATSYFASCKPTLKPLLKRDVASCYDSMWFDDIIVA